MKVLFLDWNCYGRHDVLDALKRLGHEVIHFSVEKEKKLLGFSKKLIKEAVQKIYEDDISLAFSINYFPNVSEACEQCNCKYISWIYDNPYNKVYSINIINSCNYIFTFDRKMYHDFCRQYVKTVYYAPLAANIDRLDSFRLSSKERKKYASEISFIGALYDENYNHYDELLELLNAKNDNYTIGYINGLIDVQRKVYGHNFLSDALHAKPKVLETFPDSIGDTSQPYLHFTTFEDSFSNHILCRKIANIERYETLTLLSSRFQTKLYTQNPKAIVGQCANGGYVIYTSESPKIYKSSKINLNITLRSIQTGIPLRAMDIMGAGGFLLTNYQEDFLLHFEPDIDFVYYSEPEELMEKTEFYLSHDSVREKIAKNGHQKMAENHTYTKQIAQMIEIAFLASP